MPTPKQVFWTALISLAVMAAVKHVAPRIPVAGEFVTKVAG